MLAAAGITTQLIKPAAPGGGEVFLEPTGSPGRDPFSGTVVVGNPPGTKSQTPVGATGSSVPTIAGRRPALYGGSRNEHVCDRQKLITFLQQNPEKAAAWAGVLNIDPADIATYIGTLTPMQLRADTRVTNHGFVDGHATSLQSVLQAGTAVLVDDHGRPRVKCGCGNPLLDPVATPIAPVYTGEAWPDFNPRNVSAVSPGQAARSAGSSSTTSGSADTFYRPRGTDGDQDQPTPPTSGADDRAGPDDDRSVAPTVVSCRRGTHLDGSVCVADAPVRCPDGQPLQGGRCVATQVSCPGRHPRVRQRPDVRPRPARLRHRSASQQQRHHGLRQRLQRELPGGHRPEERDLRHRHHPHVRPRLPRELHQQVHRGLSGGLPPGRAGRLRTDHADLPGRKHQDDRPAVPRGHRATTTPVRAAADVQAVNDPDSRLGSGCQRDVGACEVRTKHGEANGHGGRARRR